jgi:uncharacterized protein (DUF934 family)
MQLIKDRQIVEDSYQYIADAESLMDGNITVSLTRWQNDKAQLRNHAGKVGLRLNFDDAFETIGDDLNSLPLIELNFSFFGDGRLFSRAKLLRIRFGYQGEIRAVGSFMLDQIFYLSKVGVNAFQLDNSTSTEVALAALNDFSVSYQTTAENQPLLS